VAEEQYDVFISYKSEDLALAEDLNARLRAEGFRVWLDRARLNPGCRWQQEIEAGCEASRIILPVLTPRWQQSEWTKYETYGAECAIPLLFEGEFADVAPPPLCESQFLDLRQPTDSAWRQLFASIRAHLKHPAPDKGRRLVYVPYAPNPYFVGRESELLELHEKLCRAPVVTLTHGPAFVLAGMGGVGKTTLAREYAEKFWRLYRDILWVRAESGLLATEFARLAVEMGLIRQPSDDANLDARRALGELERGPRRLLVLDNAVDEESVQEWIPKSGQCRTVITSRFTGWSPGMQSLHLNVLEPEPARELLLSRGGLPDTEANRTAADRLAERLGYLPLALEQAAAYMREAAIDCARYLELYAEARQELLAQRRLGSTQYPDSVATTWHATMQRLSPLAVLILRLAAFLAPDPIPRDLIYGARQSFGSALGPPCPWWQRLWRRGRASAAATPSEPELTEALAELSRYSMADLTPEAFTIHRLVQAVLRDQLGEPDQRAWAERAVRAVSRAFPAVEFTNWSTCEALLLHGLACCGHMQAWDLVFPEAGKLANQVAYYLAVRAQYEDAETAFRQALEIKRQWFGEEGPSYATSLNNLAGLYYTQGRYEEAEPLHHQVMEIWRRALGEEHPDYATSLNNLAELLRTQGRYEEAEPLYREALETRRRALGEEHPDYAASLNNLALLYYTQGRYEEAERLHHQVLEITRRALGEEHPDYAQSLNNLAALYYTQGRYEEAEPLLRQAMEIRRRALGEEHPDYAQSLNNLAELLRTQGRDEEAEPLLRHASETRRRALGEEHPDYAASLNNLALLYYTQGRYEEAEPLFRQALEIRRRALGEEHRDYAAGLNNLAELLRTQGRYEEAEPLYRQALEIGRRALGEEHPDYATSLNNLALLYYTQGRYEEAEPLYREALETMRRALGEEHPLYATGLANLAGLCSDQGRHEEAEPLFRQALEIRRKKLGEDHPDTQSTAARLAALHARMREP